MKKLEVKYLDIVVGYTYDEGNSIEFLDNELAKEVIGKINSNNTVGISSRGIELVYEDSNLK